MRDNDIVMPGCSPGIHNMMYTMVSYMIWRCLECTDLMKRMTVCDAPDHCHTFQSTPIVKYTQNGPLLDSLWSMSTSLENSQIPWGFPDQSADLMKKVAFCGAPDHSHTFQSAPIVKYTKNGPLPEVWWSVSTSLKKKSDTMWILRSMGRPGQPGWSAQGSVRGWQHLPYVEHKSGM